MPKATIPSDPAPARAPLVCGGCIFGTRVVDVEERRPDTEDGEGWKPTERREVEGYYCTHPVVHDPGESSVIITGRIFCGFRREASLAP